MMHTTKEFKFAMSHLLENHDGLCSNLHGHGYKLFITVGRTHGEIIKTQGSSNGMVIDFKGLKQLVNKNIVDELDHSFVYNCFDEKSKRVAEALKNLLNQKLFAIPFRTTAENMAMFIYKRLNFELVKNEYNLGVRVVEVKLYETDSSYVVYKK